VGLLLLGAAAGPPFLPTLTELAKGNLPFAVGIMVLLTVGTVGYLPLVLPLLLPGITVNSEKIAGWLFLLTLLPLAAGFALRAWYGEIAAWMKPVLDWVTNVSLVPMVLLLAVANVDKILHIFGTRGILAGFLFDRTGLWRWLDARGTRHRHATGIGPWHRAAQHRRRTRGGRRKLQRSERAHHANSCYDSGVADAPATMSRAGQLRLQAVREVAVTDDSGSCASCA